MSHIRELTESALGRRRLGLLEAICKADTRLGYEVDTEQFERMHDDYISNWQAMQEDLRWMKGLGWVAFEESAAGVNGVRTQAEAREVVEQFHALRSDPMQRMIAARDAYLRWLYECDVSDLTDTTYDAFKASGHGNHYGVTFTDREITKAAAWLIAKGYIKATLMMVGVYTSPKITTSGSDVLESYGSLTNVPSSPNSSITHVNVNGSHGSNVNVGGNNVTQSTAVTIEQVEEANKFVASARDLVEHLGLNSDEQAEVLEIIDEVEAEASASTPKKNVLVELISKTKELALLGTASGIVHAFGQVANVAIAAIGG